MNFDKYISWEATTEIKRMNILTTSQNFFKTPALLHANIYLLSLKISMRFLGFYINKII